MDILWQEKIYLSLTNRTFGSLSINIGHIDQCILNIVHLKLKITPLLLRFQQYNICTSLDKLALRNRGVWHKENSGPLGEGGFHPHLGNSFRSVGSQFFFYTVNFTYIKSLSLKGHAFILKSLELGKLTKVSKSPNQKLENWLRFFLQSAKT